MKELEFVKIKSKYNKLLNNFKTYQSELKNFLIEDALNGQDICISTTYLIFDKKEHYKNKNDISKLSLLGYVTITNDSISLDSKLKEKFQEKGIIYKALPALKIGRLCVDEDYERRGLGRLILAFCIKRAAYLNKQIACRFITLDAKRNNERSKDSYHFYHKFNFQILINKNKTKEELIRQKSGTTALYLDIYHIIKKLSIC